MHRLRSTLALLAALSGLTAGSGFGQEAPDPARLEAVERDLKQSEDESRRLAAQATATAREVEKLRTESIAMAHDIQDQEYSLLVMENRIADMEARATELSETLGRRDSQMRESLLALQRLAVHPADALTLYPLTPDDAVRAAILLRAALPNITQSTTILQSELKELYHVRGEVIDQRAEAAKATAALVEKRKRLEEIVKAKGEQQIKLAARSDAAGARAQKLAQEAADLRALFAKLAEEKKRREAEERKVEEARRAAEEKAPAPRPASKPPDDVTVIRSFAKARGTLPFPVAGTLAATYGEVADPEDTSGLRTKGITIRAAPGAQVVAPFDGLIAFAGPFRGYGRLLIIEHSEGYHTLLAGMGRIDGEVGQRVLAGEPVGVMEGTPAPSLYVELRRDGQPINPLPWLADRTGKIARR